jgi:hypothetical protein
VSVVQHASQTTLVTLSGQLLAAAFGWRTTMMLYYLAVLLGLVALYGKGDVSTTGFIYQAF